MARRLDKSPDFEVILIERRSYRYYPIAALRAVVDPNVEEKLFIPYDKAFKTVKVVQAFVETMDEKAVHLDRPIKHNGTSTSTINFDYCVIATGTTYSFVAKCDTEEPQQGIQKLHELRSKVEKAETIILGGGGPVGIELAAEIKSAYKDKSVTLIHGSKHLGPPTTAASFQKALLKTETDLGVKVMLETKITGVKQEDSADALYTVMTDSEKDPALVCDLYIQCYGMSPNTNLFKKHLSDIIAENGYITVQKTLQVSSKDHEKTYQNIFAIGDVADIGETKLHFRVDGHAKIVEANIRTLKDGKSDLKNYALPTKEIMLVAMGPKHGVSQIPPPGSPWPLVQGNLPTRLYKSEELGINDAWATLGYSKIPGKPLGIGGLGLERYLLKVGKVIMA